MKVSRYVSRIRRLSNSVAKQERLRTHSHVVLMNPKDYDCVFNAVLGDADAKGKFLTIAKLVAIKIPYIGKRKFQIMKWKDYLKLWERYELKFKLLSKASKERAEKEMKIRAQITNPKDARAFGNSEVPA